MQTQSIPLKRDKPDPFQNARLFHDSKCRWTISPNCIDSLYEVGEFTTNNEYRLKRQLPL
jgi:hypothetical protein